MARISTLPRKPRLSEKLASTLPNCARALSEFVLDNPDRPDGEQLIRAAMFIESLGYWKLAHAEELRRRKNGQPSAYEIFDAQVARDNS